MWKIGTTGPEYNRRGSTRSREVSRAGLLLVLLLALLVPACGTRRDGIIGVVDAAAPPQAEPGARRHTIFVATTRAKAADPAILYSGARSQSLNLAEVAVTVPDVHTPWQDRAEPYGQA